jgi:SAM-dependent methyltransferase
MPPQAAADPQRADMNPAEFDNIALTERTHWWYRGQRQILREFLSPFVTHRPDLVLEGGCGTGYNAKVLAQDYGWRMVPVDLGMLGLRYAHGYGLSRLCQADIAKLPFADQTFDHVVSLDVIVHFPRGRESEAFGELSRVLKPGGLFIARVSALDILRSRHSMHASERQRFTQSRLISSAQEAGLKVLRCTYANSLLMPVALFKFRVWEPLTNAAPSSGVMPVAPWLDRCLYSALAIESKAVAAGLRFPLGQSLLMVARK